MYADVTGKPRLDMREVYEYREKVNMVAGKKQKDEDLVVFAPMQLAQIRKVPSASSRPCLSALALGSPPPLLLCSLLFPRRFFSLFSLSSCLWGRNTKQRQGDELGALLLLALPPCCQS